RSHGRGNDYVNDSCTDSGSGFLRVDEGKSTATWDVAAGTRGITEGVFEVVSSRPNNRSQWAPGTRICMSIHSGCAGTQPELSSRGGTMKTAKRKVQMALTIISLTFLVLLAAGYTVAGQRPSLSKKEVKAWIASAKTKADHLKLAEFYKTEVARLQAEATD